MALDPVVNAPFPATVHAQKDKAGGTRDIFQPDHQMGMAVALIKKEPRQHREHRHKQGGKAGKESAGDGQPAADFQQNHQRQEKAGDAVAGHQV